MPTRYNVLIVDDNPADADLIEEAFDDEGHRVQLHRVVDGIEALEFVRRSGAYAEAPRPDIVLLDLNLPRRDGREVLAELRSDDALREIPVIVLTSSDAEADVAIAYRLGANAYIRKPMGFAQFQHILQSLAQFWFEIVRLPNR